MHDAHEFLKAITVVLCVAAVTTVVFQRLRQPVVLGYILAGLIVGPYIPIPLAADRATIQSLSELGVILLMFSLGLEFSLRKLAEVGPVAALTAVVETSFMVWLGFMVGHALGWTTRESVFAGAIVAISSTTIVAKAFDEQRVEPRLRERVVGVLIVEDLIAILLMAILTALASGDRLSAGTLVRSGGRLAAFLIGLVSVGMLVVPRTVRAVNRLERPETTLVASIGLCFAIALLAREFGYSVALGAFIAGSLVAESGEEKHIGHLIVPVRDMFAAIFFVSVGMLIDPAVIAERWTSLLVLTLVVLFGKVIGVSLGAFLTGGGIRTSVQTGMSLAQIGEFSFIIAGLGVSLGATRGFLYPVAVAISAITTLTTPWLIRVAGRVASFIDRKLPGPVQTFASLYGTWVEDLRSRREKTSAHRVRRLFRLLLLDVASLAALVIGAALSIDAITEVAASRFGISQRLARALVVLGAFALAVPLLVGILRITGGLGAALALSTMPKPAPGQVDLANAPRRALVTTLQVAVMLLVGVPIVALLQPFLPDWTLVAVLVPLFIAFGFVFWRSAADLEGHVKAGAEMIIELLAAQGGKRARDDVLAPVRQLMPGLGDPVPARLDETSRAVGKTLAELDLRGLTGASVLAIARGDKGVIVPTATEVLRAGDVLALTGTRDAIAAAVAMLNEGRPAAPP